MDQRAPLVRRVAAAASSIQLPYARSDISGLTFDDLADAVSHRCSAQMVKVQPGEEILYDLGNKYVVSISLDPVDSLVVFASGESLLSPSFPYAQQYYEVMEKVASDFPDHLIIYSSDSSRLMRRQLEDTSDSGTLFSAPNPTVAEGGILKRYQLLTPGLILTLIVVFFVVVPIIAFGINALASIQSPLRVEAPRSFSAKDKKNQ